MSNLQDLQTLTYSASNMMRNCPRSYYYRYVQELVPLGRDETPMYFGSLIHECLEAYYNGEAKEVIQKKIDARYADKMHLPEDRRHWMVAREMMEAYMQSRPADGEEWRPVVLEKEFMGHIFNPDTWAKSRSFKMRGKIDGIVKKPDGTFWTLEHKTTSAVTGDYFDRLWMDMQNLIYSYYAEERLGFPIAGTIYNVLVKPRLAQRQGETEEEYEARCAALVAKSKTGKTSAKRKLPESDEDYRARLAEWFSQADAFQRFELIYNNTDYDMVLAQLWDITQQILTAARFNRWFQNTSYCFHWGRACPYYQICKSGGNKMVIETHYEHKPAHGELSNEKGELEI